MQWRQTMCDAGHCIEVQHEYGSVILRSSKHPQDLLIVDQEEWDEFVAAVKRGEFDQL